MSDLNKLCPGRGHARIFSRFIEQSLESRSEAALRDAMSSAAQALGLHSFAYINISARAEVQPRLVSTYPIAWTTRYLREGHDQHDPVIILAKQCLTPFDWGGDTWISSMSPKGKEIFTEAAQHGIRHGFSIPIPNDAGLHVAVSFATDERRSSFDSCIGEYGAVLQFMAMLFHRQIRCIASTERQIGDVALTSREFECLEWASHGKSAWEIGRILNISRCTAAFHLANAKKKIGVRTINQAIAKFATARSSSRW